MNLIGEYRGYLGSINVECDGSLTGKIVGIKDLICYQCSTRNTQDLVDAFREAVDEYIDTCHELGWEPNATN